MADRLIVREYQPHDRDGVRRLLESTYATAESFDRFETGSPLGDTLRVVAEFGGEVVGFNHWQPWLVSAPGGDILVYQSGASAVGPSMRGQGVFAKLLAEGDAAARRRGVSFFLGFPNPASFGSFLRAGWEHIATMNVRIALFPALGRESGGRVTSDDSVGHPFWSWRYQRADVERLRVSAAGSEERTLFFRRDRRRGVPLVRLLDVRDASGNRNVRGLARLVRHLPGPAPVFLRSSPDAGVSPWSAPRVPRSWDTPVILKRHHGDAATEERLRRASYLYGDIDAA